MSIRSSLKLCAGSALLLGLSASLAHADEASLQQQIKELQAQVEALAEAQEQQPAASGSRVHWGGYGELHYNNLDADDPSRDVDQIDFHRFVLFASYDFTSSLRFVSELELEHSLAGDGKPGEVELEQAYIEGDINDRVSLRGGLMLVPVGSLNETHEPPVFYGVERNNVESIIVPSTWWAGGIAASIKLAEGLQGDVVVHEGLKVPTSGSSAFRIRSGRQKTAEADGSDLAYTARLRYTGVQGLAMNLALQYQTDISQVAGDGLDEGALYALDANWTRGPVTLKAMYAGWMLGGVAVETADADEQTGWYLEPSYKLSEKFGVYARFEDLDAARSQDKFHQWQLGINYYPHPQVVLKADFRQREHDMAADAGRDFDGFDLGIGYDF